MALKGNRMRTKHLLACLSVVTFCCAAWYGLPESKPRSADAWIEVESGLWRTAQAPYSYALLRHGHGLVIDATAPAGSLQKYGFDKIDMVLLTHHHRDAVRHTQSFLDAGIPVRAAKVAESWLTEAGVRKYWQDALPLRNSTTAYFVVPHGYRGIDFSLIDQQTISWQGSELRVVATPGHSRDHLAFAWLKQQQAPVLFAGDALAGPGKLWVPYTTDWDHWTDMGLKPTAASLRTLAKLKPRVVFPAHGNALSVDCSSILDDTAARVEEVAFLRSFERFSQRLGNVPQYPFLVPKEQVASAGDKPWSRVSDHLWITGNTYVLVSKQDKAFLVLDPWGQRSADQIARLKKDQKLGPLELVMFSHAHYDHYDGIHLLPGRESFKVWTLDRVAEPIVAPNRYRAPFIDARTVKVDRLLKDNESANWHEYTFRFHFFPGQTEFTMAIETVIDNKKCLFTADNFFHQDQFSGSGGWMGLNRSFPGPYGLSAQKVLDLSPDWILAEHGGPFVFNHEDFKRRVQWGRTSSDAANAICVSGWHRRDWDPHRVRVEPIVNSARPGDTIHFNIMINNILDKTDSYKLFLDGDRLTDDQSWSIEVPAHKKVEKAVTVKLKNQLPKGRHILIIRNEDISGQESVDSFCAIDVE